MHSLLLGALAALALLGPGHPKEFWREIAKKEYAPPAGTSLTELSEELLEMLGSPDPELRDDIAYSTLAQWIYQKKLLDPPAVRELLGRLSANLGKDVGGQGSDAVFRRSFSALMLSVVVARDNAGPFLGQAEYRRLLDATLRYLADEKDVRGYDAVKGWMHSTAHTADLLKFLARSRHFEAADQARVLAAVALKLSTTGSVFTHGEDERLARAVLAIVNRKDFDAAAFAGWAERSKPAFPKAALPTVAQLSAMQNLKNLFAKLEVLLSAEAEPPEGVRAARDAVRATLKGAY